MVINSNISAMNTNNYLKLVNYSLGKNTEKLSSGYKINRSADDAAGLAVSEKMRRQIRGLTRASANAQDGVSLCQIADGVLDEVNEILKRAKTLAIQASNDTLSDDDRAYLQEEVQALYDEINRVHETTVFNETEVFCEGGYYWHDNKFTPDGKLFSESVPGQLSEENQISNCNINIEWSFVGLDGTKDTVTNTQGVGTDNGSLATSSMAQYIQKTAATTVNKLSSLYPNLFSKASSDGIKIGLNFQNIDGKNGVLASAELSLSAGSTTTDMGYTLNIDISDYPVNSFDSMSDEKKADLSATIAHEMTHLIMYDTVTNGMLSNKTTSFPSWFVEGAAQTSSGDNGWVTNRLSTTSSDDTIKAYMKDLFDSPYGAGYLATMYLGQAASGASSVSSTNIAKGLDKILTSVADGKTLDEAIQTHTSFSGLSQFESDFRNGKTGVLNFVKGLLSAVGTNGAGSLLDDLSKSEKDVFAPGSQTGTPGNKYMIDPSNTKFANTYNDGYNIPPAGNNGSGQNKDEEKQKLLEAAKGVPKNILFGDLLNLHVGAEKDQTIAMLRFDVSTFGLFFNGVESATEEDGIWEYEEPMDVSTTDKAQRSIVIIDRAAEKVDGIRAYYGGMQNRLEHTIKNLDNVVENTTAAESRIRDTDMAEEMVAYSNENILKQASESMLSQANQSKQMILSLLG